MNTGSKKIPESSWSNHPSLRWLTLFASSGTLLCCALPIMLVSLGFGAVVASLKLSVPGLLFLEQHKNWTLALSAAFLLFLAWLIWRPHQHCPSDPVLAQQCHRAKAWNKRIFFLSAAIWFTGFFFSTLLLPLRQWLNF